MSQAQGEQVLSPPKAPSGPVLPAEEKRPRAKPAALRSPFSPSSWFCLLLFLGACTYSLDRFLAYRSLREAVEAKAGEIQEAQALIRAEPGAFGEQEKNARPDLAALLRQAAQVNQIGLVSLTQNDREAGQGIREQRVIARAVRVAHGPWVQFLADLERQAPGSRVKEIRLGFSKDEAGVYQEAECVLAFRFPQ